MNPILNKTILCIIILFLYSCFSSPSPSDSVSVDLLQLDAIAPKYINGTSKFLPDETNSNLDFYDFLAGTKHAVLLFNDEMHEQIENGNDLSWEAASVYKKFLWGIGFDYVAISNEQSEEIFDKHAASFCDVAYFQVFFEMGDTYSGALKFNNIKFDFHSCQGDKFTFSDNRWISASEDLWEELLFTKLTQLFWHNIPKDVNHRILLSTESYQTEWTDNNLKKWFGNNHVDMLEGIYEQLYNEKNAMSGDYKIGIKWNDTSARYDIIYLAGANNYEDWKKGEIKGFMHETGTPNLYKIKWFQANKKINDDVYGFIDENNFFTLRYGSAINENSDVKYLKLFPTKSSVPSINLSENYKASGTGFAISNDGFIVTNYHVIEPANQIIIESSKIGEKKSYNAKVILSDEKNDLSILKIDDVNFSGFGKIPFALNQNVSNMGTKVYTLGYPLISTMGESIKLTDGLISSQMGFQGDISSYQVSIPIQPGNSGGPLFDYAGNLIGVVNAKHLGAENVTYAIKSNYLENMIQLLPETPDLNKNNSLKNYELSTQVSLVEDFIFLIKIK